MWPLKEVPLPIQIPRKHEYTGGKKKKKKEQKKKKIKKEREKKKEKKSKFSLNCPKV